MGGRAGEWKGAGGAAPSADRGAFPGGAWGVALLAACIWLLALLPNVARAQARPEAPTPAGWRFLIEPYGFLPVSITGTATVRGNTIPFQIDPAEVLSKFELGGALRLEAWKRRWGIIFDNGYIQLGDKGTLPGPAAMPFDVTTRLYVGSLSAGFRPLKWQPPGSYVPSVLLEVDAGMRLTWTGADLTLGAAQRNASHWFPELTGDIHVPVRLTEHWALRFRGAIGVADTVSWKFMALAECEFRPVVVSLGYRFDSIRHAGSGVALHVDMHSIYFALGFRFGAAPFYP